MSQMTPGGQCLYSVYPTVKVTLSLGRETEMCTVRMLVWAERAASHVDALYANIPKSFQKHNLRPTCRLTISIAMVVRRILSTGFWAYFTKCVYHLRFQQGMAMKLSKCP